MRDGIILYRALLDEVRHNMEAEKTAVTTFCRQLHETISQLQERLLADVEGYADVDTTTRRIRDTHTREQTS